MCLPYTRTGAPCARTPFSLRLESLPTTCSPVPMLYEWTSELLPHYAVTMTWQNAPKLCHAGLRFAFGTHPGPRQQFCMFMPTGHNHLTTTRQRSHSCVRLPYFLSGIPAPHSPCCPDAPFTFCQNVCSQLLLPLFCRQKAVQEQQRKMERTSQNRRTFHLLLPLYLQ